MKLEFRRLSTLEPDFCSLDPVPIFKNFYNFCSVGVYFDNRGPLEFLRVVSNREYPFLENRSDNIRFVGVQS